MQNKHNIINPAEPVVEYCEEAIMGGTEQHSDLLQAQADTAFDQSTAQWTGRSA
jgi:hypothetical protein